MRLCIDTLEFEGDLTELATLVESCKAVSNILGAKTIALGGGQSLTLDSYQVWDDDDEPSP